MNGSRGRRRARVTRRVSFTLGAVLLVSKFAEEGCKLSSGCAQSFLGTRSCRGCGRGRLSRGSCKLPMCVSLLKAT